MPPSNQDGGMIPLNRPLRILRLVCMGPTLVFECGLHLGMSKSKARRLAFDNRTLTMHCILLVSGHLLHGTSKAVGINAQNTAQGRARSLLSKRQVEQVSQDGCLGRRRASLKPRMVINSHTVGRPLIIANVNECSTCARCLLNMKRS